MGPNAAAGAAVGATGDGLTGAEVGSGAVSGVLEGGAVGCTSVWVGGGAALVAASVLASREVSVSPDEAVVDLSARSGTGSVVGGAQDANVKASIRPPRMMSHTVFIERHKSPLGSLRLYTHASGSASLVYWRRYTCFLWKAVSVHAREAKGAVSGRK